MRTAAKVDANQSAVVAALRAIGAHVHPTHQLGGGFPDLVVSYRGKWWLLEVKDGKKSPSRRRLTLDEQQFKDLAQAPVFVVLDEQDAINAITGQLAPF